MDNESDLNNNIVISLPTTTITTTTITICTTTIIISTTTTIHSIIEQAQILKNKIDTYKTAAGILVPSIYGAVIFAVSILGYYIKKCYMNNGYCKVKNNIAICTSFTFCYF